MGLCNEERIEGMYYSIDKIYQLGKELKNVKMRDNNVMELTNSLWHNFFHSDSNSTHWLFGSSAYNTITSESMSPWAVAVRNNCEKSLKEKEDYYEKEKFNPFDSFLSVRGLLKGELKTYFEIFSWVEQLSYYLKRYDDEILERYIEVSKSVSLLYGELFKIFNSNEEYAKAYVLNKICEIVYSNNFPYKENEYDYLTKWLVKNNIHHDLSKGMRMGLSELSKIHISLSKNKTNNTFNRLLIVLKICDSSTYTHQLKNLFELGDGVITDKQIIRVNNIHKRIQDAKKRKEEKERRENSTNYKEDSLLGLYGYSNLR